MNLTGNTIFITGGAAGFGGGLAEAFHKLDNKVIISGRRREHLHAVATANPGMDAVELDVCDPWGIADVARRLINDYPSLNVVLNNAGVTIPDDAAGPVDERGLNTEIETNLLGPVRVTAALIGHLKAQPQAAIIYKTSVCAFTPLAPFSIHSATKAALHSYVMSQRLALRGTSVSVREIMAPRLAAGEPGSPHHAQVVPLERFVHAAIDVLEGDAEETPGEEAALRHDGPSPNRHAEMTALDTLVPMRVALASAPDNRRRVKRFSTPGSANHPQAAKKERPMTAEANQETSRSRSVFASVWNFIQNLDHSAYGYSMDRIDYAMGRIRVLEREVEELKTRLPR